jgi:hypothetical protein
MQGRPARHNHVRTLARRTSGRAPPLRAKTALRRRPAENAPGSGSPLSAKYGLSSFPSIFRRDRLTWHDAIGYHEPGFPQGIAS